MLNEDLNNYLNAIKKKGLYRKRKIIKGDKPIIFNSNDYLGMSRAPDIKSAYIQGAKRCSVGSLGSMYMCGYHQRHQVVEEAFSRVLKVERSMLFTSGYMANLAITMLLGQMPWQVFIDKQIHASIYDGLKISGLRFSRFLHNNVQDLEKKISSFDNKKIILTESLFSMSGQKAPLESFATVGEYHNAGLIVDEAHAFGVFGEQGLGLTFKQERLLRQMPLRVISLGKAFASSGAIIAGDALWIESLEQCARSLIYSTAISPATAYGLEYTLDKICQAGKARQKLKRLVYHFNCKRKESAFHWQESQSQIQRLYLGCSHKAIQLSQYLYSKGVICSAVRPPTVALKESGLRIVLRADHSVEDIDAFFEAIEAW